MNRKGKPFPGFILLAVLFAPFGFTAEDEEVYLRAELSREAEETDTLEDLSLEEEKYLRPELPHEEEQEPFLKSDLSQNLIETILEDYKGSTKIFVSEEQIAELAYYEYSTAKRRLDDPEELVPYAIFYYQTVTTFPGKQHVLEEALTYAQEAWGEQGAELIDIYRLMGNNQYFLGDWDAAKKSYKQAEKLIKKNKLGNELLARHFANVGYFLRRNNQSYAGYDYAWKARKAARKLSGAEHVELQARIEYELGYLKFMQGDLKKAEKFALDALEILNESELENLTHYNTGLLLANIAHRQGDINATMDYIFTFARHPAAEERDSISLAAYPVRTAEPSYNSMSDNFEIFTVRTRFTVSIDGLVSDVEILEEDVDPVIEESVLKALEKFRFAPRIVDAKRVETKYRYTFLFSSIPSRWTQPYDWGDLDIRYGGELGNLSN